MSRKRVAVLGGSKEFSRFLQKCGDICLTRFSDMTTMLTAAMESDFQAIFLLSANDGAILPPADFPNMRRLAQLRRRGQKLYAELYDTGDYNSRGIFGCMADTGLRAIHDEVLNWNGTLLQLRGLSYLPGRVTEGGEAVAMLENSIGVHAPVIPGTVSFPGIACCEGFYSAFFPMSRYDRYTMLPRRDWRMLYGKIFGFLLEESATQVEAAFDAVWQPVSLSGEASTPTDAVHRAVRWHLESGILPDPSGASGCYEMIRSSDLHVRMNQRTDAMLLSAAVFATAGSHFGDETLLQKGKNLADYCLSEHLQYESGPNKGLFHWFHDLEVGPNQIYSSDTGRDAIAMLQLYLATGEARYLDAAKRTAEAFLRWTGEEALFTQAYFITDRDTLETLSRDGVPQNAPSFYDAPAILMSSLWKLTGDARYRSWVEKMVAAVGSAYPGYTMNFTPKTYNLLYSRLLTVLASAQAIGCGDHTALIRELLCFFRPLQDASGGFGDSAVIETAETYTHPEFSVGMGNKYDRVVDNLYCTNNLLEALSLLRSLPEQEDGIRRDADTMLEKLIHFVTVTQLTEPDSRLYGGWMRAFDLETWEYYGIAKDKDWGPYCIMGGWVMGFLPLTLLNSLGAKTVFSLPGKK